MSKRSLMVVAAGVAALLVAGGLYASNMGFKLNYPLENRDTTESGLQSIAFPYNQQTSLVSARDVKTDVDATVPASFLSLSKWVKSKDAFDTYTGQAGGVEFDLTPGEGYLIQVDLPVNYIIVGSHNPGLIVNLDSKGTSGSASGLQLFAYPYHAVADTARALFAEINLAAVDGSAVLSISTWLRASDVWATYTGQAGGDEFDLVPGEAYLIQVEDDVAYVPAHY